MEKQKEVIKKIEEILRSKRKFQKYALNTYVKNYYVCKDIIFDEIKRPKGVDKSVSMKTLLNFDAHYDCITAELLTAYTGHKANKHWKVNFCLVNGCVRKVLQDLLKDLKQKGGRNSSQA